MGRRKVTITPSLPKPLTVLESLMYQSESILEFTAPELVQYSKSDTPTRYARRLKIARPKVTTARLIYSTGDALIELLVNDREVSILVEDFVGLVADELLDNYKDGIKRSELVRLSIQAIRLLLEHGDILIDCSCPDYKYRFNWIAKQYGYALRNRIQGHNYSPDLANPQLKGGLCKHLFKALSRMSDWTDAASRRIINDLLAFDGFLELVGVMDDEELDKEMDDFLDASDEEASELDFVDEEEIDHPLKRVISRKPLNEEEESDEDEDA